MIDFQLVGSAWWNWFSQITWQLAVFVTLVTLTTFLLRKVSPDFRYGLWMLVLVRVFIPPDLSAPWSPMNWLPKTSKDIPITLPAILSPPNASIFDEAGSSKPAESESTQLRLFYVWMAGAFISASIVLLQYMRVLRRTQTLPQIEEGPVKIALERAALNLGLESPPDVHTSATSESPFLIGVLKPRIVLPQTFAANADHRDLQAILQHELVHWKHKDTWVGWLQVASQCVMWFHPFVWYANARLRHEREMVCDAAVLRAGKIEPVEYGESILRVLTLARGRSLAKGGLVGVFERGARIQDRLESVMQFRHVGPNRRWHSTLAVLAFGVAFLPLAPYPKHGPEVSAQVMPLAEPGSPIATVVPAQKTRETTASEQSQAAAEHAKQPRTPYPQIVKTQPAAGATDVDPALKMIRVKFDRDMGEGMSWTGGEPEFPPTVTTEKTKWIDKRTCVLPVKLKRAAYYRVGINSKSYMNFKDKNGTPCPPAAIFFTTRGASTALKNRVRIPSIVNLTPEAGAHDIAPGTTKLTVTFDVPMGTGMSWTGGGENFPKIPQGQKPEWSRDGRTCSLPVRLAPNHSYQLGLNSLSHKNFQSKWGVPLPPVTYRFTTSESNE